MHERLSVHSICFADSDVAEISRNWSALGSRRVSFLSPMLEYGISPLQEVFDRGGFQLEQISHKFTENPIGARPADWEQQRERLTRVIEAVAALNGRSINLIAGGHGNQTWEESAEMFAAAIAPCRQVAERLGINLLIEPIPALYAAGHIAHTLRDTITLAEQAGLGVCIDIFSSWTESGLRPSIERAMPRCHLVQVGDYAMGDKSYPCREILGAGDIPLRQIIGWILNAGYEGIFEIEVFGPRIKEAGSVEAVRRSADYLGNLLQELGA